MVCNEDVPHAQHPHHHDLVLETDHPNEQTTGAAGEVSTYFIAEVICFVGSTSITSRIVPDCPDCCATELPLSFIYIYFQQITTLP